MGGGRVAFKRLTAFLHEQEDNEKLRQVQEIPASKLKDIELNLQKLEETKTLVQQLENKISAGDKECARLRCLDFFAVLRIRIGGSMPLSYGSGPGSGSCYFRHWPSGR